MFWKIKKYELEKKLRLISLLLILTYINKLKQCSISLEYSTVWECGWRWCYLKVNECYIIDVVKYIFKWHFHLAQKNSLFSLIYCARAAALAKLQAPSNQLQYGVKELCTLIIWIKTNRDFSLSVIIDLQSHILRSWETRSDFSRSAYCKILGEYSLPNLSRNFEDAAGYNSSNSWWIWNHKVYCRLSFTYPGQKFNMLTSFPS